jgi:hypothetical protein
MPSGCWMGEIDAQLQIYLLDILLVSMHTTSLIVAKEDVSWGTSAMTDEGC